MQEPKALRFERNIMAKETQLIYRHQRDIFVNKDPHATTSSGTTCSSASSAAQIKNVLNVGN